MQQVRSCDSQHMIMLTLFMGVELRGRSSRGCSSTPSEMCGVQGSRDRRDTAARSRAPEEEGVLVRVLWAGRYGRGAVDRPDALAAEVLVRALLARVLLCVLLVIG